MDELNALVDSIKICPECDRTKYVYLMAWGNGGENTKVVWSVVCTYCKTEVYGDTISEAVEKWNQLPREEE